MPFDTRSITVLVASDTGVSILHFFEVGNDLTGDHAFDIVAPTTLEDRNRARKGHSATNLAMIRHLALNLIQQEKTTKVGVKTKRAKAGWDNHYLLKILGMI